jgi:hypothetical protein
VYQAVGAGQWSISPATNWIALIASGSADYGTGSAFDSSGNMYVDGSGFSPSNPSYLVKISPTGIVIWKKQFNTGWIGGSPNTYNGSIRIDSSGNIYIFGTWDSSPKQFLLVKLDSDGNILWQNRVGDASVNSEAYSLTLDASGAPIVVGYQIESGAGAYQFILKETTAGAVSWARKRGGTTSDYAQSVATDSSSNVYVGGRTNTGSSYGTIAQYNSSGTVQWELASSSSFSIYTYAMAVSGSSVYAVQTTSTNRVFLVKTNTSGTVQWQKELVPSSGTLSGFAADVDSSGNIYVAGVLNGSPNKGFVAKFNSSGTLLFFNTLEYPASNITIRAIKINGSIMSVSGWVYISSNDAFSTYFPTDGSATGAYGSFTYASASASSNSGILSISSNLLSAGSPSSTLTATTFAASSSSVSVVRYS